MLRLPAVWSLQAACISSPPSLLCSCLLYVPKDDRLSRAMERRMPKCGIWVSLLLLSLNPTRFHSPPFSRFLSLYLSHPFFCSGLAPALLGAAKANTASPSCCDDSRHCDRCNGWMNTQQSATLTNLLIDPQHKHTHINTHMLTYSKSDLLYIF